jgi:hypothetical protein
MLARALFLGAGLLAASLGPARSDSVTALVAAWDPVSRTITLEDKSQFADIPADVAVPPTLRAGDEVTVEYEATENGIEAINRIEVTREFAKRTVPPAKKGG